MTSSISPKTIADPTFAEDVRKGLTAEPKYLLSRYFYDAEGDRLFQKIMELPEYYPTRCEFEIFRNHRADILRHMGDEPFDMVELGAGDGQKTQVLMEHFLAENADFKYLPIDISANVLAQLKSTLASRWPQLNVQPVEDTYFSALKKITELSDRRKLVLFLGSNIGNMKPAETVLFFRQLRERLHPKDLLLIGIDLKKDPVTILAAYNDRQGVTRDFNLNLLHRINRELDADFDVDAFRHWPMYNPLTGDVKSYLVSEREQTVHLRTLDLKVHFRAWEAIDMELSKKYDMEGIKQLAGQAGFELERSFFDEKKYFADLVWRAV